MYPLASLTAHAWKGAGCPHRRHHPLLPPHVRVLGYRPVQSSAPYRGRPDHDWYGGSLWVTQICTAIGALDAQSGPEEPGEPGRALWGGRIQNQHGALSEEGLNEGSQASVYYLR